MSYMIDPKMMTLQISAETLEDAKIIAKRRNQSLSQFVRELIDAEIALDATKTVITEESGE